MYVLYLLRIRLIILNRSISKTCFGQFLRNRLNSPFSHEIIVREIHANWTELRFICKKWRLVFDCQNIKRTCAIRSRARLASIWLMRLFFRWCGVSRRWSRPPAHLPSLSRTPCHATRRPSARYHHQHPLLTNYVLQPIT